VWHNIQGFAKRAKPASEASNHPQPAPNRPPGPTQLPFSVGTTTCKTYSRTASFQERGASPPKRSNFPQSSTL
jgi:hypothetical protein